MKKKILTLRTCKQWFEKLIAGEIQHKYKEMKPYRTSRLLEKDETIRNYDEIHIKNGYKNDSPTVIMACDGIDVVEKNGEMMFQITLGEILNIAHYQN